MSEHMNIGDAAKAFPHAQKQIFTFVKKSGAQGFDAGHRHNPSTRLIVWMRVHPVLGRISLQSEAARIYTLIHCHLRHAVFEELRINQLANVLALGQPHVARTVLVGIG